MRLAGINTRGTNAEPMNGQGVYPVQKSLAMSWNMRSRVAARTFAFRYDVRAGVAILLCFPMSWDIREFKGAVFAMAWDSLQFATQIYSFNWIVSAHVLRTLRFRWRVPFSLRRSSALTVRTGHSPLSRHSSVSSISRD